MGKSPQNNTTMGELIMAEWASFTQRSGRLEYRSRFVGPGGWG